MLPVRIGFMKKTFLLALFVFVAPLASAASTAVQIDDTHALFTINFSFEDADFTNEIPVIAKHGVEYNDRVDHLGYDIATNEEPSVSIERVTAIVLSDAPLNGDRYFVPVGTKEVFTLVVLADFGASIPENDYQARITKLPYWLRGDRTTVHQNQLDDLARPVLEVN